MLEARHNLVVVCGAEDCRFGGIELPRGLLGKDIFTVDGMDGNLGRKDSAFEY